MKEVIQEAGRMVSKLLNGKVKDIETAYQKGGGDLAIDLKVQLEPGDFAGAYKITAGISFLPGSKIKDQLVQNFNNNQLMLKLKSPKEDRS